MLKNTSHTTIFPLLYLPNIDYFILLINNKTPIFLEKYENFQKQTYRNRTRIMSASGIQNLIIPVDKGSTMQKPYREVRISYHQNWQKLHLNALKTCYHKTAFFEFYIADIIPFYEKKWTFLFDYNAEFLLLLLKLLHIDTPLHFTETWQPINDTEQDYRTCLHPKKASIITEFKPYFQTFEDRLGFQQNLSILDLLFSCGADSLLYLKKYQ